MNVPTATSAPLLAIEDLSVHFATRSGAIMAVHDMNLEIGKREIVALVGESGSGKSTTAMAIARLLPPRTTVQGRVAFEGMDLLKISEERMRKLRGNRIGIIFQDPLSSLNPVKTIGWQIAEALKTHLQMDRASRNKRVVELLKLVGIPTAGEQLHRYPHQFSGGMRQRVMVAMAIACNPSLLIADEPTTALDVTIQAKIIELLSDLRDRLDMSILLITHNLGLVARLADRVVVASAGQNIESAPVEELFERPEHPFTKALIAAVPRVDQAGDGLAG